MQTSHRYCTTCGAANETQDAFCFNCGHPLRTTTSMQYPSKRLASSNQTGHLAPNHLLKQRYRILSLLEKGGFGAVYKAVDTQLGNRPVAIKEMLQLNPNQQEIDAFKREAEMLAHLMHPHLPSIHEHFDEAGLWYLVMEFIEGETLGDYVKAKGGRLPIPEVLDIGIQLCTVLNFLHTHQPPIIFRDLKPANIMRTPDGHIYLIDFGIARHFNPNQNNTAPLGTLGYAAPEQTGKHPRATPQSDIYTLGATLHQLLSGEDPSDNPYNFASLQLHGQAVPPELGTLIKQMLEMDASKRPASMAAVKQKLEDIKVKLAEKSLLPVNSPRGGRFSSEEHPGNRGLPFPPIQFTPTRTRTLAIIATVIVLIVVVAFSIPPLLHNSAQSSSQPALSSSSNTPAPAPTATSFPSPTPVPPTPSPTPQPGPGTVLCQADASHGWNGWNGTSDWKVSNGMLLNDGTNASYYTQPTIVAPCQPQVADYAVEATMQVVSALTTSTVYPCFEITVRGVPSSDAWQGYAAGVCPISSVGARIVARDTNNDSPLVSAPFDPGTASHTYRVEVKGTTINLLIDGGLILTKNDNRFLSGGQVGLMCFNMQVNVSSFKIIAL